MIQMIMWHLLRELCCAKKQVDMSLYVIYVYTAHMLDLFHGSPGEGGVSLSEYASECIERDSKHNTVRYQ